MKKNKMNDIGKFLLDVRTKVEYEEISVEGFVNIPLADIPNNLNALPRDQIILIVCASGMRSSGACKLLTSLGYKVEDGGSYVNFIE